MIDRQLVIECDSCETTFDGESGEWSEVWPAAQRQGWSSRKIGDVWVHGCPECGRPK